ncbi:hypothetical protein QAD02_007935 [Eretmocerus hayati]|uniref:Uncharacterized protein n=1 Tax=Eretmocerus hayati TaxID=131215 RepID=A0ACC2N6D4_9HYME|nr:hypothetical protein QAD02_007935 [Eretmocerus hayati]
MWLNLRFDAPNQQRLLDERRNRALSDAAYAAYLLHPEMRDDLGEEKLQPELVQRAITFINEHLNPEENRKLYAAIQTELGIYLGQLPSQCALISRRNLPAGAYWSMVQGLLPNIARLGKRLALIPAGTGQIESYFSHWAYVQNLFKSELGHERSCKAVDCQYTLSKKTI